MAVPIAPAAVEPWSQQQMISDAMQAIAQRKPGKTKLVYDKTKRTIVAVRVILAEQNLEFEGTET